MRACAAALLSILVVVLGSTLESCETPRITWRGGFVNATLPASYTSSCEIDSVAELVSALAGFHVHVIGDSTLRMPLQFFQSEWLRCEFAPGQDTVSLNVAEPYRDFCGALLRGTKTFLTVGSALDQFLLTYGLMRYVEDYTETTWWKEWVVGVGNVAVVPPNVTTPSPATKRSQNNKPAQKKPAAGKGGARGRTLLSIDEPVESTGLENSAASLDASVPSPAGLLAHLPQSQDGVHAAPLTQSTVAPPIAAPVEFLEDATTALAAPGAAVAASQAAVSVSTPPSTIAQDHTAAAGGSVPIAPLAATVAVPTASLLVAPASTSVTPPAAAASNALDQEPAATPAVPNDAPLVPATLAVSPASATPLPLSGAPVVPGIPPQQLPVAIGGAAPAASPAASPVSRPNVVVLGAWAFHATYPREGDPRDPYARSAAALLSAYDARVRSFLRTLVVQPSYASYWSKGRIIWRAALPTEFPPSVLLQTPDGRTTKAPMHRSAEMAVRANRVAAQAIRDIAPAIRWLSQNQILRHSGEGAPPNGAFALTRDGTHYYPPVQVVIMRHILHRVRRYLTLQAQLWAAQRAFARVDMPVRDDEGEGSGAGAAAAAPLPSGSPAGQGSPRLVTTVACYGAWGLPCAHPALPAPALPPGPPVAEGTPEPAQAPNSPAAEAPEPVQSLIPSAAAESLELAVTPGPAAAGSRTDTSDPAPGALVHTAGPPRADAAPLGSREAGGLRGSGSAAATAPGSLAAPPNTLGGIPAAAPSAPTPAAVALAPAAAPAPATTPASASAAEDAEAAEAASAGQDALDNPASANPSAGEEDEEREAVSAASAGSAPPAAPVPAPLEQQQPQQQWRQEGSSKHQTPSAPLGDTAAGAALHADAGARVLEMAPPRVAHPRPAEGPPEARAAAAAAAAAVVPQPPLLPLWVLAAAAVVLAVGCAVLVARRRCHPSSSTPSAPARGRSGSHSKTQEGKGTTDAWGGRVQQQRSPEGGAGVDDAAPHGRQRLRV